METYKCKYCEKELAMDMAQFTILEGGKFLGSVCLDCEKKVKRIEVWKVGNDDMGWCYVDNYKEARDILIEGSDLVDEFELIKETMLDVDYKNIPEFEGW